MPGLCQLGADDVGPPASGATPKGGASDNGSIDRIVQILTPPTLIIR